MRDLFAILAIIAAVVALGLFKVPNQNALVDAGIRSEAQAAVYQQPHPISVSVAKGALTVSGRVESEAAREALLADLAALDGVERVVDALTVLPTVSPFTLELVWTGAEVTMQGYVASQEQAEALRVLFPPDISLPDAPPSLTVAAGAPDGWAGVVALAAARMPEMLEGRLSVIDRALTLSGQVHLPVQLDAMTAALAELPEGYEIDLQVDAVDDGLPYRLVADRDPRMGLSILGKLPPGWDRAGLDVLGPPHRADLAIAPLPLDQPGFTPALEAALPIFAGMPRGTLIVTATQVALSGGPVPSGLAARAEALRGALPPGVALDLALVPQDDDAPLSLTAEWDGAGLILSGKVPRDFPEGLGRETGLTRAPYPDLTGWTGAATARLAALAPLERGSLSIGPEGTHLSGVAADPERQAQALGALKGGIAEIALQDDGAPPGIALRYDVTTGAAVSGKLPADVTQSDLSQALGVPLDGDLPVSPASGDGALLPSLAALAPWLPEIDSADLDWSPEGLSLDIFTRPASDPQALHEILTAALPPDAALLVAASETAATGDRRPNALTGGTELFLSGHWLPELLFAPDAANCATRAAALELPSFPEGRFALGPGSAVPLAEAAALARACTRIAGLRVQITAHADSATIPELNGQLSRRRAEALRAELIARGVPAEAVTASGRGDDGQGSRLDLRFAN